MANPFDQDVQAVVDQGPTPASVDTALPPEDMKLIDESLAEGERDDMYGKFWRRATMDADDPNPDANVEEFAEINRVEKGRAKQLLQTYSEKDAKVLSKVDELAEKKPGLLKWAEANPDNYKFMRDHFPELLKTMEPAEESAVPYYLKDMSKALKRNMPMLENMVAVGRYSVGEMSKEEFAAKLENIRQRRDNQTPYATDVTGFEQAMKEFNRSWKKGDSFADIYHTPIEDKEDMLKVFVRAAQVSGASVEDIINLATAFAINGDATALKSIESLGSMVGPTVGAAAGSWAGRWGGPKTALVGGLAGGTVGSGLVRYAQEVEEQLNNYVDANPGSTYLQALDDPEIMANIKKVATAYGLVGGLLDTTLTRLGGNIATKGVKGFALGLGVEAAGEGVAEAGATTAKGVAQGKPVLDAASEGMREGVIESLLVTPTTATMSFIPGVSSAMANKVIEVKRKTKAKQSAQVVKGQMDKIKEGAKDIVKSPEDAAKLRDALDTLTQRDEVAKAREERDAPVTDAPETPVTDAVEEVDDKAVPEDAVEETVDRPPRARKRSQLGEEAALENVPEIQPEGIAINPGLLYQKFHSLPEDQRQMEWEEYLRYFPEYIQEQLRNASDDTIIVYIKPEHWAVAQSQGKTEDLDEVVMVNTAWGMEPAVPQDEDVAPKKKEEETVEAKPKEEAKKGTEKVITKKFGRFKSLAEENQYNDLKKRVIKSLGGVVGEDKATPPEVVQVYTDMFFNMAKARAELIGKPIASVLSQYEFADKGLTQGFAGFIITMQPGYKRTIIGYNKKHITRGDGLATLVHEFGHLLLNNMIRDWEYIHSLSEEEITPDQQHYKEMMKLTADVLGLKNLKGTFDRKKVKGRNFNPAQEKFATSIELFFKRGEFKDSKTGRLMLRFQQLMQKYINKESLARVGQSYVKQGITPIRPETERGQEAAMVFHSLIDANEKLTQEVYALVQPPEFDRKDLGEEYTRWMNKYREAVETALLKVYKEIFNDNIDFYRTHYNEVYSSEYEALLKSNLGTLHNLMRDGFIILSESDLKDHFGYGKTEFKLLRETYGLTLAKKKGDASTNLNALIEQGVLNWETYRTEFEAAVRLEETAVANTIKALEERNEDIPRQELRDMSNIILNDENIRKVRIEAGQIVKRKLLKELNSNEEIADSLKKEIKKGLTDEVLTRKAKEKFLNTGHRYHQWVTDLTKDENRLTKQKPKLAFNIFTSTYESRPVRSDATAQAVMRRYLRSATGLKDAKARRDKELRVEESIDTGEIPELFDSIEQLLISEKKEGIIRKVNKRLDQIQNAWDRNMSPKRQIIIKKKGQPDIYIINGMVSTEKAMGPFDKTKDTTLNDDGLYNLANEIMRNREFKNAWGRLKYGHLLMEADLKSQVLTKIQVVADPSDTKSVDITSNEVAALMKVDAAPKVSVDAMPLPPVPETEVVVGPKKSMSIEDAHTAVANKIVGEVRELKKARPIPENMIQQYMYMDSISMTNFIASMMDEKDLPTSLLYKIFREVSTAEAKKNTEQIKFHNRLTNAAKKFSKSKKGLNKLLGKEKKGLFSFLSIFSGKGSNIIKAPEIGENVSFSNLGQVVTALLYMGSESGRRKVLMGGFLNSEGVETGPLATDNGMELDTSGWDAFIQRLINEGVLTEEAFDFIQEVHDIFTEIYPLVKQSFVDVEGKEINFVEGREYTVTLANGTKKKYKGGYYPLLPDRTLVPVEGTTSGFSDEQHSIVYDTLDHSMSRHRGGQIYPLQLGLANLMGLLNKHLTHAYIKKPMMVVENLRKNKRVVQMFENRQRGFVSRVLNPWIERVTKQTFAVPGGSPFQNSWALFARRTAYMTLFLAKLGPIGKQFLGIVQAMPTTAQYVGSARMLKHFIKVAGGFSTFQYPGLKKEIAEKSVFMKDRLDNNERHLVQGWDDMELVQSKFEAVRSKGEHLAFFGMQITQNIVDMGIWLAAVEKVKSEGKTDQEAYNYADGLVERTQASSNISAKARALHGTNWERMAMMITMVAHGIRGRIYENAVRAEDKGNSVFLARLNAITMMVIVPGIIEHAVSQALEQLGDDDEDKKDPEIPELMAKILGDTAVSYSPMIAQVIMPFMGGSINMAVGAERRGGGEFFGLGPVVGLARKAERGFTALSQSIIYGVPMSPKDQENLIIGISLFGIPVSPATYMIKLNEMTKSSSQKKREAKKRRKQLDRAKKRR